MFCRNCGAQIPEGTTACPNCHAVNGEVRAQTEKKNGGFRAPTQGGKKAIAICSALTLIPIIFIIMIDLFVDLKFDWDKTGGWIGFLLVLFICTVLPSIRITPAPVTTGICFLTVCAYIMYVLKLVNGNMDWFTEMALPLILVFCVFLGLDSVLVGDGKVSGSGKGVLYCLEAFIFSIAWSVLYTNYKGLDLAELQSIGLFDGIEGLMIRVPILFAAFFLTLTVIFAAAWYVGKVRKQQK